MDYLDFEQPLSDLSDEIDQLKANATNPDCPELADRIQSMRKQLTDQTRELYSRLTPWETVQVARHKNRPHTTDYLSLVFDEFVELHGDKLFGDDPAIRTGFASLGDMKVMVVGHQKGRTFNDRQKTHFGCAHPEGYRKAMAKMRKAEKYGMPVICMIDTPGAYPGVGAEERGQAQVIAENMYEMSRLKTPIICVVIGEGGSGGALGIGVGDRVAVLENAYYSVISPEGCAGILWKGAEHAEKAATALKFTSKHLLEMGIVDDIINEPLGGAHRDHHAMAARLRRYFQKNLKELVAVDTERLLADRYEKFRKIGVFMEQPTEA